MKIRNTLEIQKITYLDVLIEKIYWFFKKLSCDHNWVVEYESYTNISYHRCNKCEKSYNDN